MVSGANFQFTSSTVTRAPGVSAVTVGGTAGGRGQGLPISPPGQLREVLPPVPARCCRLTRAGENGQLPVIDAEGVDRPGGSASRRYASARWVACRVRRPACLSQATRLGRRRRAPRPRACVARRRAAAAGGARRQPRTRGGFGGRRPCGREGAARGDGPRRPGGDGSDAQACGPDLSRRSSKWGAWLRRCVRRRRMRTSLRGSRSPATRPTRPRSRGRLLLLPRPARERLGRLDGGDHGTERWGSARVRHRRGRRPPRGPLPSRAIASRLSEADARSSRSPVTGRG